MKKEKKPSPIIRLLGYAGKYKKLTVAGLFLSAVSMILGMLPYICIWLVVRALLKDAPIVLLDEATASLDVENETKVQGALSRLLKNKTVVVIAHRMRTVEAADKIVVLEDGKVVEQGSPKQLNQKKDSIFKKMAQLQSQSEVWSV